jgi:hypothetical protein
MLPRWQRLKMIEIAGTKDKERWERAGWFYRVIERHAEAFVAVAIELEPLKRAAHYAGMPFGRYTNPYILAHRVIIDATLQYQRELGISEPIDFVFDEYGHAPVVRDGWELFAASRPRALKELLGRSPRFERDDECLPLQAADMLAWHAREHWLKHGSLTAAPLVLSWPPKRNPRGYLFNFDYTDLLKWFRGARSRAVEAGAIPKVTIEVTFSSDLSDPEQSR